MFSCDHFILENFEGSLDFLVCLIQKEELDLYSVSLQDLLSQFQKQKNSEEEAKLDYSAEFIHTIAFLIWLKSRRLLPQDQPLVEENPIEEPPLKMVQHLIDYCRFKEAAKELAARESEERSCYFRGIEPQEWQKPFGIDHVSLDDLSLLFKTIVKRANSEIQKIHEEFWKVSEKMKIILASMECKHSLSFVSLFSEKQTRLEMIVIFLALLELIKNGTLAIGKEKEEIFLFKREEN